MTSHTVLTDTQIQALRNGQGGTSSHIIEDGYVIDMDTESNPNGGSGDGTEWTDEVTEVYLGDLHKSARSPYVLHIFL